MNPYSGASFFEFWAVFFSRLFSGELFLGLVSDEVQLFVLCACGISTALVGTFLLLRKMTMLANALAHTLLCGIVIAFLLGQDRHELGFSLSLMELFTAGMGAAILTVILTQWICHTLKVAEDASMGLVFSFLFALGILLVTVFARSAHIGIEVIMGSSDALLPRDVSPVLSVMGINMVTLLLFYKEFQACSFDEHYCSHQGLKPQLFHYLLMLQVALTMMAAFRAIGAFLPLALIVGLPMSVRPFARTLPQLLMGSALLGVLLPASSIAASRAFLSQANLALSTGGLCVAFLVLFFLGSSFWDYWSRQRKLSIKQAHSDC